MMSINPYMDYYEPDFGAAAEGLGIAGLLLGVMLVVYLVMFAFMIAVYVLQSLGFYQIAKRRGIHNPWLAWVPVGNMWILGSISDQYQYVAKGKTRNRRKVLMGLTIAMYALIVPFTVGYMALIFSAVAEHSYSGADLMAGAGMAFALIAYLAMMVVSVVAIVFEYIALYDLFVSCDPHNSVMYIVLSIFVNVTLPFFLFACRKKDYGMPSRKPQPQVIEPVEEAPEEACEEVIPAAEVPAEEVLPTEEEDKTE